MEDLLREILAPSPVIQAASLPTGPQSPPAAEAPSQREQQTAPAPKATPSSASSLSAETGDWQGEAEMQRLLDMLPGLQSDEHVDEFPSALDMELCGWDEMGGTGTLGASMEVGVF